jgi:protein-tyrosine sulfotransferase
MLQRMDRLRRRLIAQAWRHVPAKSELRPVVVGGSGRSGTTLMRVILDAHPNLCCGDESDIFRRALRWNLGWQETLAANFDLPAERIKQMVAASRSQTGFIERFAATYAAASNKRRWADKSPKNVLVLPWIFRHFPEARFVHMIRDGRDVASSLRTLPRHKVVDGKLVKLNTWKPIDGCAERWRNFVSKGLAYRGHPNYFEVRYEDLVIDPEPILRKLLTFLGEPWDDAVLRFDEANRNQRDVTRFPQNPEVFRPLYTSSMARWKRDMTADEIDTFKQIAGPLLIKLGYVADDRWGLDDAAAAPRDASSAPTGAGAERDDQLELSRSATRPVPDATGVDSAD